MRKTYAAGSGIIYLVAVGTEAEVLDSLAGILRATQQQRVRSGRGPQSELIQGQRLAASLFDTGTGGGSEAQGSHRHLGCVQETVVISDRADDDDGLALVCVGQVGRDPRERHWGPVDLGHEQTTQNDLVEIRVRAA